MVMDSLRYWVEDMHVDGFRFDLAPVLGRTDSHRRTSRWLFAMLHSWDWLPLLERRPLWDVLLIVLSLGGAVMSVTGVVIGLRRLGAKFAFAADPTSQLGGRGRRRRARVLPTAGG